MLLLALGSLTITLIAIYVSFNTREEIVQLAMVIIAVLGLLLSIVFSPLSIKLLLVLALLFSQSFISTSTKISSSKSVR